MKIIIFVSYTYPFIGSGIGNVSLKQAEGLAKLGHQVTLISANVPPLQKKNFKRNGVYHIKIDSINALSKFHIPVPFFFFNIKTLKALKDADVVHIHDILYPYSFQAGILAKIFEKKLVLTQHIGPIDYPNKLINLLQKLVTITLGRIVLRLSDKIIFVNEEVGKNFNVKKIKTGILINGVDTDLFKPVSSKRKKELRKKYNIGEDKKVVLFVGRFVPKKGFDKLYDARSDKYLILFAGGGNVPKNMTKDPKKVRFLGNLTQDKLSEIYKLSDVFVLPSKSEGLPLSIQEALATGLPVITSKNPGYESYFKESPVTYTTPIPSEIKKTILKVLSDNKINNGYKSLKGFYDWNDNVKDLVRIYKL